MAWTAPKTWTVGEVATAANVNLHVRDQFKYLGGADGRGTSLPGSPQDGQLFVYVADDTNGVEWLFKYHTSSTKWRFIGGPPLFSEITTSESTSSTSYVNLTTTGPAITLPLAADYDVETGFTGSGGNNVGGIMSYDIGATAAVDADKASASALTVQGAGSQPSSAMRARRKTGLSAVTLTAKYKSPGGSSVGFENRWMRVAPVRV